MGRAELGDPLGACRPDACGRREGATAPALLLHADLLSFNDSSGPTNTKVFCLLGFWNSNRHRAAFATGLYTALGVGGAELGFSALATFQKKHLERLKFLVPGCTPDQRKQTLWKGA